MPHVLGFHIRYLEKRVMLLKETALCQLPHYVKEGTGPQKLTDFTKICLLTPNNAYSSYPIVPPWQSQKKTKLRQIRIQRDPDPLSYMQSLVPNWGG